MLAVLRDVLPIADLVQNERLELLRVPPPPSCPASQALPPEPGRAAPGSTSRLIFANDVVGCACRREKAEPLHGLEAGKAGFGGRRQIRKLRVTRQPAGGKRAHHPSLDLRQDSERRQQDELVSPVATASAAGAPPR